MCIRDRDTTATSLQDMTEFELPQKKLQRVQPEGAKDGYLYFQLDTCLLYTSRCV